MRYKVYEFNPDDAYNFARHVGIEVKEHGGELFFKTCPYASQELQEEMFVPFR